MYLTLASYDVSDWVNSKIGASFAVRKNPAAHSRTKGRNPHAGGKLKDNQSDKVESKMSGGSAAGCTYSAETQVG